jgi:hypothetical protein
MNQTISSMGARQVKVLLLKELIDRREYLVDEKQLAQAMVERWLTPPAVHAN